MEYLSASSLVAAGWERRGEEREMVTAGLVTVSPIIQSQLRPKEAESGQNYRWRLEDSQIAVSDLGEE